MSDFLKVNHSISKCVVVMTVMVKVMVKLVPNPLSAAVSEILTSFEMTVIESVTSCFEPWNARRATVHS